MSDAPRFRLLASGKVQQTLDAETTQFDPETWASYTKAGKSVRACRVPKPFLVAGDLCSDGWLVKDDRGLMAVSNESFCREYELALVLGPAVEA